MKKGTAAAVLACLVGSVFAAHTARADAKEYFYQRHLRAEQRLAHAMDWLSGGMFDGAAPLLPAVMPDAGSGTQAYTFTQKVNPDDPSDTRTFEQRYYLNSTYASGPSAPVIFLMCGEAPCTGDEFSGEVMVYAQKYKANLIELEHRYYGKSVPVAPLTPENMQYLSTDLALKDFAAFERYAITKHGLAGKWVSIGGSYPGSLSAYFRMRYPDLVVGALASSAPVIAKANFEEYDLDVATVAGPACAAVMRTVVNKVETALGTPAGEAQMKAMFDASDVKDDVDFLYVIADMGAIAIQYGNKDTLCNALTSAQTAGSDVVQAYATVGKELFQEFGITAVEDSFQGAESTDPNDYLGTFGMRSWLYQDCKEYGYWQVAYHDPAISVRSAKINLPYHDAVCNRMFGIQQSVQTDGVNNALYKPLLDASTSRILFTNGSTDPWSKLSVTAENANNTNPNTQSFLIDGGSHCSDLSSFGSASVQQAQTLFETLLTSWLK